MEEECHTNLDSKLSLPLSQLDNGVPDSPLNFAAFPDLANSHLDEFRNSSRFHCHLRNRNVHDNL